MIASQFRTLVRLLYRGIACNRTSEISLQVPGIRNCPKLDVLTLLGQSEADKLALQPEHWDKVLMGIVG